MCAAHNVLSSLLEACYFLAVKYSLSRFVPCHIQTSLHRSPTRHLPVAVHRLARAGVREPKLSRISRKNRSACGRRSPHLRLRYLLWRAADFCYGYEPRCSVTYHIISTCLSNLQSLRRSHGLCRSSVRTGPTTGHWVRHMRFFAFYLLLFLLIESNSCELNRNFIVPISVVCNDTELASKVSLLPYLPPSVSVYWPYLMGLPPTSAPAEDYALSRAFSKAHTAAGMNPNKVAFMLLLGIDFQYPKRYPFGLGDYTTCQLNATGLVDAAGQVCVCSSL